MSIEWRSIIDRYKQRWGAFDKFNLPAILSNKYYKNYKPGIQVQIFKEHEVNTLRIFALVAVVCIAPLANLVAMQKSKTLAEIVQQERKLLAAQQDAAAKQGKINEWAKFKSAKVDQLQKIQNENDYAETAIGKITDQEIRKKLLAQLDQLGINDEQRIVAMIQTKQTYQTAFDGIHAIRVEAEDVVKQEEQAEWERRAQREAARKERELKEQLAAAQEARTKLQKLQAQLEKEKDTPFVTTAARTDYARRQGAVQVALAQAPSTPPDDLARYQTTWEQNHTAPQHIKDLERAAKSLQHSMNYYEDDHYYKKDRISYKFQEAYEAWATATHKAIQECDTLEKLKTLEENISKEYSEMQNTARQKQRQVDSNVREYQYQLQREIKYASDHLAREIEEGSLSIEEEAEYRKIIATAQDKLSSQDEATLKAAWEKLPQDLRMHAEAVKKRFTAEYKAFDAYLAATILRYTVKHDLFTLLKKHTTAVTKAYKETTKQQSIWRKKFSWLCADSKEVTTAQMERRIALATKLSESIEDKQEIQALVTMLENYDLVTQKALPQSTRLLNWFRNSTKAKLTTAVGIAALAVKLFMHYKATARA